MNLRKLLGKYRLKSIWKSVRYYATGIYHRISSEPLLINGGSIAFSILMWLIPWLLLLFSAFGFFLSTEESMAAVEQNISQFIPLPGYEEEIHQQIQLRLDDLVEYRQTAGVFIVTGYIVKIFEQTFTDMTWLDGLIPILVGFAFTWEMFFIQGEKS